MTNSSQSAKIKPDNCLEENKFLTSDIKSFWKFNNKLGLEKILYGIDYQRCLEYPLVFNQLQLNNSIKHLLDVGTGKHSIFPLYIAYNCKNTTVRITDAKSKVFKQINNIKSNKELKEQLLHSKILIEKQYPTSFTYQNNFFDRISAVSSLEQLKENDDSNSVIEMIRILKPHGRLVISVPFNFEGYKTISCKRTKSFFSHHYDENALYEKIIKPANAADLESIIYIGEQKFAYFQFWRKYVPIRNTLRYIIGWISPIMALKHYKILDEQYKHKAHTAIITLIKR